MINSSFKSILRVSDFNAQVGTTILVFNPKNKKIIGLGRKFLQLIYRVIIYLIKLHEQNNFDGNLLKNMRIRGKKCCVKFIL